MLDLEPAWQATCSGCGVSAAVADEDKEMAHVTLRVAGWTRSATGVQLCPTCTVVAKAGHAP